jgi:hypothetical protein
MFQVILTSFPVEKSYEANFKASATEFSGLYRAGEVKFVI